MGFPKIILAVFLLAAIAMLALTRAEDSTEVWPTNGWSRATPVQMNMDWSKLKQARDYALTGGGSGIIVRHGKIVMSWGDPTRRYDLKSTGKSIGITALGLGIRDDKISLSDKAVKHHLRFGISPSGDGGGGWFDDITILHLGTMTAGFGKSGGYAKLLFAPGTKWAYSDSGPNWLAECITLAYQQDLHRLMSERVYKPLGIKSSDLLQRNHRLRPNKINGIKRREFGGISANVDAMARIGYLYLRGGKWDGLQIIPQSFVDAVRQKVPEVVGLPVSNDYYRRFAKASNHYGLLWWNNTDGTLANVPSDAYWAWGLYDSLIIVIPSVDIVVARAGSAWAGSRNPNYYKILKPFLEPIVASVRGRPTPMVNKATRGQ